MQDFGFRIKANGVRGSVPNPHESVLRYGGNTTCFEIETPSLQFFIDAGTGFRSANLNKDSKPSFLLFSHFHHDHIQGFPFNAKVYAADVNLILATALVDATYLHGALQKCFSVPYFPADIFGHSSNVKFKNFSEVCDLVSTEIKLSSLKLNHPGGAYGYSFESKGKKIVTLFDNEYVASQEKKLNDFCAFADLLIWDGMYSDAELKQKRGWGHSSIEEAIRFTESAGIKKTLITHHEPSRTDDQLDQLRIQLDTNRVDFAYEGMIIKV